MSIQSEDDLKGLQKVGRIVAGALQEIGRPIVLTAG
jgi:methionine aminopeptidase